MSFVDYTLFPILVLTIFCIVRPAAAAAVTPPREGYVKHSPPPAVIALGIFAVLGQCNKLSAHSGTGIYGGR